MWENIDEFDEGLAIAICQSFASQTNSCKPNMLSITALTGIKEF